jgi:hypothetical protein
VAAESRDELLDLLLDENEVAAITGKSVKGVRKDRYSGKGAPWVKQGWTCPHF